MTPIPTSAPEQIIIVPYEILPFDTYEILLWRSDTSPELLERFGITAEAIVPGAILSIPQANPAYCPGTLPYVVREADTLEEIASRFGKSTAALATVNNLDLDEHLRAGSVLCIR